MSAPEPSVPDSDPLFARHVPLLDHLQIRPVAASRGRAEFALTVGPNHLRTLGILHGGVVATLLDTAMGYAAGTLAPPSQTLVTAQLNMNFTKPAQEKDRLSATGEVIHAGVRTAVTRGEVRREDGSLIATGTATFLFIAPAALK